MWATLIGFLFLMVKGYFAYKMGLYPYKAGLNMRPILILQIVNGCRSVTITRILIPTESRVPILSNSVTDLKEIS